jgi:hypothetical protein
VRGLAIGAGIDLGRRYKDQSITKLAKLMVAVSSCAKGVPLAKVKQAREAEPYLARFEDDWATGQILRQYINGKQKYENAKANGSVTVGGKRKRTEPTSLASSERIQQLPSFGDYDIGGNNSTNGGGSELDEDEWMGFGNHDHDMGMNNNGDTE